MRFVGPADNGILRLQNAVGSGSAGEFGIGFSCIIPTKIDIVIDIFTSTRHIVKRFGLRKRGACTGSALRYGARSRRVASRPLVHGSARVRCCCAARSPPLPRLHRAAKPGVVLDLRGRQVGRAGNAEPVRTLASVVTPHTVFGRIAAPHEKGDVTRVSRPEKRRGLRNGPTVWWSVFPPLSSTRSD